MGPKVRKVTTPEEALAASKPGEIAFWDIGFANYRYSAEELSSAQRGAIAFEALKRTRDIIDLVKKSTKKKEKIQCAVITGPIDKSACHQAGMATTGQTELFADWFQSDSIMVLAGPKLRVGLTTNHLPLVKVATSISPELIEKKVLLLERSLRLLFQIDLPRIGVCGINPHAGDNGLLGEEDQTVVEKAINRLKVRERFKVYGPLSADTAFFHCYDGKYDAILAMYHDQGLPALKSMHFYDAINITGGLPFLRVSPDHGPASDLFLTGTARSDSYEACLRFASKYLTNTKDLVE